MITNLHFGSLGGIHRDDDGNLYTVEDLGYAYRYWFADQEEAKDYLLKFLKSYGYMLGELFLEKRPEQAIEFIRNEWTLKVCIDAAQMRMNDISLNNMIGV